MGIKQLHNDNLQKLPNKYGDISIMCMIFWQFVWFFDQAAQVFSTAV